MTPYVLVSLQLQLPWKNSFLYAVNAEKDFAITHASPIFLFTICCLCLCNLKGICREMSQFKDSLKSKNEENEAFLSEIEVIGLPFQKLTLFY